MLKREQLPVSLIADNDAPMFKKRIVIADYSPTWAFTFRQLKAVYELQLSDLIADVQHVGSTSVEGLSAKPVIDIDIVIADSKNLKTIIKKLELLGYEHRGNLGITDRASFKQTSDTTPINGSVRSWPKHHLYVCPANSVSLKNHLALRDFLHNNPEKAKQYGELKKQLALENSFDMNLYIERKTPFITGILKEVGFDEAAIASITQENKTSK